MISRLNLLGPAALLVVFSLNLQACGDSRDSNLVEGFPEGVKVMTVELLDSYPHDRQAYTQGLCWGNGRIYESTGRVGRSGIRAYRPGEDPAAEKVRLTGDQFGEGLAKIGSRIFMLTWRAGLAFVFDAGTFELTDEFTYQGEGWGLCHDGRWLIMSDGSDTLTYRDPSTFKVWKTVSVRMAGDPLYNLNELEYAEGYVYANVWQKEYLVRIDPESGKVDTVIDASSLPYESGIPGEDVLNGIAYLPERETFLLTGKLWPELYEVKFVEQP